MKKYILLGLVLSLFVSSNAFGEDTSYSIKNSYYSFEYPEFLSLKSELGEEGAYKYEFENEDKTLSVSVQSVISNKKVTKTLLEHMSKNLEESSVLQENRRYDFYKEGYLRKDDIFYSIEAIIGGKSHPVKISLRKGNVVVIVEGDIKKQKKEIIRSLGIVGKLQFDTNNSLVQEEIDNKKGKTHKTTDWLIESTHEFFYGCHITKNICFVTMEGMQGYFGYHMTHTLAQEAKIDETYAYDMYPYIVKDTFIEYSSDTQRETIELYHEKYEETSYIVLAEPWQLFAIFTKEDDRNGALDILSHIELKGTPGGPSLFDVYSQKENETKYAYFVEGFPTVDTATGDATVRFDVASHTGFVDLYSVDEDNISTYQMTLFENAQGEYSFKMKYDKNITGYKVGFYEEGVYQKNFLGDLKIKSAMGIGANLIEGTDMDVTTNFVYIQRVFLGGPAHEAGLQDDDIIIKVDGTSASYLKDVIPLLKGEEGKKVTLTIRRGEQVLDVKITRKTFYYSDLFTFH